MIEKQIKLELLKRDLKPSDVYKELDIERAHFYQAIRTHNLNNKTLNMILEYLGLEISVSLVKKGESDAEDNKI